MRITEETHEIMEKYGWTIICESPLEIEHPDGSFATMMVAEAFINATVAAELRKRKKKK